MKKQNEEGQSVSVKGRMKEKKRKIRRNWFIKFLIRRKKLEENRRTKKVE